MTNTDVANRLQEHARELRQKHENLYRVKAYRRAANLLLRLDRPLEEIVHERGPVGLAELPGIGKRLAGTIAVYLSTGEWPEHN